MCDMNIDFDDLIETVFTSSIKEPYHYNISFTDELEIKDLFEFLLMTFTNGSKILYGDTNNKVNINEWDVNIISDINRRFNSLGFKCQIQVFHSVEAYFDTGIRSYRDITITSTTHLNELYFSIKCENMIYVINFDYLTTLPTLNN